MRDLEDVPQETILVAVPPGRGHDLVDRFVVDIGHEQRVGLAAAFEERRLQDHAVLVAVDKFGRVLAPREWAMDEEFNALRA